MSRRAWVAFAVLQVAGEICSWTWPHLVSFLGPCLWVGSVVLLLPGNILGSQVVLGLLWQRGLTLLDLQLIGMALEVAINAVVWLLVARLIGILRKPHSS